MSACLPNYVLMQGSVMILMINWVSLRTNKALFDEFSPYLLSMHGLKNWSLTWTAPSWWSFSAWLCSMYQQRPPPVLTLSPKVTFSILFDFFKISIAHCGNVLHKLLWFSGINIISNRRNIMRWSKGDKRIAAVTLEYIFDSELFCCGPVKHEKPSNCWYQDQCWVRLPLLFHIGLQM